MQELESDDLRAHLSLFAESLNKARTMMYPARKSSKIAEMLPGLADIVDKEHKKLLARKILIERRKEDQERQLLEKVYYANQMLLHKETLFVYSIFCTIFQSDILTKSFP